ncbi:vWA domain-containing protein [Noviherbaspirillum soli]|uniref:vWA domain-containing protein n=1 Tax=Noviherbaspirillum soli TaxID=1064518 RepID=UPI00188C3C90|nr:vWA domain-containing protein [Noviherbaspirillum soli]
MRHLIRQSAQVLPMTALLLVLLVGAVGMALDSGRAYLVRARLAAAVDAAGLAAARAVTRGEDAASRKASAVAAAGRAFRANYPDGYLSSTPQLRTPQLSFEQGRVLVDTSASASLPLGLTAVMGFTGIDVEASAQAMRRDLDLALVLDVSTSLAPVAQQVRDAAVLFLERFSPDTDRVALVRFAYGAVVDMPIRTGQRGFDRPAMRRQLQAAQFSGYTNSAEGLWQGHAQLNSVLATQRSSLRVMVFFSDGVPTAFASRFGVAAPAGCDVAGVLVSDIDGVSVRGLWRMDRQEEPVPGCAAVTLSPQALPPFYNAHGERADLPVAGGAPRSVGARPSWINVNRAARNLAEAMAARARADGIHVYTVGLGPELLQYGGADGESGSDMLKCMANSADAPLRCRAPSQPAGVHCHARDAAELKPCFAILGAEILRLTK